MMSHREKIEVAVGAAHWATNCECDEYDGLGLRDEHYRRRTIRTQYEINVSQ